MAYTTIDKGSSYFDTKLYTGTGSAQTISGLNFSPDFIWTKNRTGANSHQLYDNVRGVQKALFSNGIDQEETAATNLTAFTSDGFSVGAPNSGLNGSGTNIVAWCWDANGSGSSNTSGSITSTVSANTTSGFSIVSYTGAGGASTVGHGLGVAPKLIIVKTRSNFGLDWIVGSTSLGWTKLLRLNKTDAQDTNNYWNDTAPTSSVFSVYNSANVNASGYTYIGYCFAEIKGYSKFGTYTGNGSSDGAFVYTGFKPAFIIQKTTSTTSDWNIVDNKRSTYNVNNLRLNPNQPNSESTSPNYCDLLSNGFKFRASSSGINGSGETNFYMALAENPFVTSTGIPTTAR